MTWTGNAAHDFTRPSGAGVYNCLLGQPDCFPADRALVAELTDPGKGHPGLRVLARVNRDFVLKAAAWAAAMLGIDQYLDLGCGLPLDPSVHTAARGPEQDATVVYADKDPLVISHVQAVAVSEGWTGTAVVKADAADPQAVLEQVLLLREPDGGLLINPARPVCAVFGAPPPPMMAARMMNRHVRPRSGSRRCGWCTGA